MCMCMCMCVCVYIYIYTYIHTYIICKTLVKSSDGQHLAYHTSCDMSCYVTSRIIMTDYSNASSSNNDNANNNNNYHNTHTTASTATTTTTTTTTTNNDHNTSDNNNHDNNNNNTDKVVIFGAAQAGVFDDRVYVLILHKNSDLRIQQHQRNKCPVVKCPYLRTSEISAN